MRVLMIGRRPSIALDDLRKYWGEVEFTTGFAMPKAVRYDLVIAQEPTLRVGVPALLQAKLTGAKLICEVHGNYLWTEFLPWKDLVAATLVLKSSNYVRAVSTQIANGLKCLGIKRVLIIPSVYIKLDLFRPLTAHGERGPVVLSASRLVPEKGLNLLIDSIPLLLEDFPGLEVRIVGDGPERSRLETRVERLGVRKAVRFFGWVGQDELIRHYNEASVFVCSSFHEGGPRTVFEAAACHTPFVSTSVGLVPEVFRHGREGFILQERDPELLAEYASRLLESPGLRGEMGRLGREVVEREFEWGRAVKRYAEAYLKIVGG
ncbi:MAG: glycosyltransferase family 4 protein [Nitrososphaerota archaeon]|nr:glycosyltransferase family 4 protein [Candidatus Calditenuaceae archaeon]MDW8073625.1 glycosyltransferase family 4 protein [Nitrososphaerota archaeon]